VNLDLSQCGHGRVIFGALLLQWIAYTSVRPYRLTRFKVVHRGHRLLLSSDTGEGWDQVQSTSFSTEIELVPQGDRLDVRACVDHPEKVRVIKMVVQGLPPGTLRAVASDREYRIGARHRPVEYPSRWSTPFLWLQPDTWGSRRFVASCVPWPIARKAFSARLRPSGDVELALCEEACGSLYGQPLAGSTWHLQWTSSHIRALEEHGVELGQIRELVPFDERPDVPEWAKKCPLAVMLNGIDPNGRVHLDYQGMISSLRLLARHGSLENALVCVVGWDGSQVRGQPFLRPHALMGGKEGLRRVVQEAHLLGARVVLQICPVAMPLSTARQELVAAYQARDLRGHPSCCPPRDRDGDGFEEHEWIILNLAFDEYRQLLLARCEELVETCHVDGFLLTHVETYVPDPRKEFFSGWQSLVGELQELNQGGVLVSEGLADYICCLSPLFEPRCRADAPDFQLTIGRWGRSIAYSGVADARNRAGARGLIHAQYRPLKGVSRDVIPSVAVGRETLEGDLQDLLAALKWSRDWQELYGPEQVAQA